MAKYKTGFISNSSSEAFVCATNKSLKQIKTELELILDIYNQVTKDNLVFNDVFKEPKLGTKEDINTLKDYCSFHNVKINIIRKPIIYSNSDNSVPYAFFEFIADAFKAQHIHLG